MTDYQSQYEALKRALWHWKGREMSDGKPPFKLIDNDPGSHLWVMGSTMAEKYRMPVMGKYMMDYAERIKALEAENETLKARIASLSTTRKAARPGGL